MNSSSYTFTPHHSLIQSILFHKMNILGCIVCAHTIATHSLIFCVEGHRLSFVLYWSIRILRTWLSNIENSWVDPNHPIQTIVQSQKHFLLDVGTAMRYTWTYHCMKKSKIMEGFVSIICYPSFIQEVIPGWMRSPVGVLVSLISHLVVCIQIFELVLLQRHPGIHP